MKKALEYSKMLERVGLTREQAEVHLNVMEQAMREETATKQDITDLRGEIAGLRSELKADVGELRTGFKNLETRMESEFVTIRKEMVQGMQSLEYKITTKLGMIVTVAMTGLATFFKFFI